MHTIAIRCKPDAAGSGVASTITMCRLKASLQVPCFNSCGVKFRKQVVSQYRSLQVLYVAGNQLKRLPEDLVQSTGLQGLKVSYNSLEHLPPDWGAMVALTALLLRGNRLDDVPVSVAKLPSLRIVRLEGNPLQVRPLDD
jgi:Leucine-rich repeat (LRR) protein